MSESRKYLDTIVKLHARSMPEAAMASPQAYQLKHGRVWGPQTMPNGVKRGKARHCYVNAYQLALRNPCRFFYVEGMAVSVCPVPHAWCVDKEGRVIDCTPHWQNATDYFGVKFTLRTLHAIQRITNGYGVFTYWEHWEKIRKKLQA